MGSNYKYQAKRERQITSTISTILISDICKKDSGAIQYVGRYVPEFSELRP